MPPPGCQAPSRLSPPPGSPPEAGCPTGEGLARASLSHVFLGTNAKKSSKCGRQKSRIAWLSTGTRGASCPHRGARPEAGYAHNPALHSKPGAPRGRDWHGPASHVSFWVRMQKKVLSVDGKRAMLPGSPRAPGEPWAPAGVPGRKPAEPTTRLSIRTRVPTLKHPLRSLHRQPLEHGGLTPGTPPRFSGLTFAAFLGSPRGPGGTWLSARPFGRPKAVLPTRAVQPDPPTASAHLPTAPLTPTLVLPKRTFAHFAGLPVPNGGTRRGHRATRLNQG